MRELKFRAWDRLNKEMINVYVIDQTGKAGTGANANKSKGYNDTGQKVFYLHDVKLMQCTGLKDKNGKEIYEGDILRLFYPRNYGFAGIQKEEKIVIIEFQSGAFWFTGGGVTDCNWHFYNAEDREVIGNIYENPELI